ncbi:hypothetical protein C8J57DRAFT_1255477 [Mycena rebaudengoi]|nr:hypothetical protein C8J57DRAFT_1255477 [Mycena rebaudengoi]
MATGKMMGGGERIPMTLKYGEAHMRFSRAFYEAHMRSDLIKNDVNTKVVELFKGFPMVLVSPLAESNNPNPRGKSELKSDLIRNDVNTKIVELFKGFLVVPILPLATL